MKHLTWADIDAATDLLTKRIHASKFQPEFLIGITTGGLIPLALLAKKLDVSEVLSICARSYAGHDRRQLDIKYRPNADLHGKHILLIDEIADSGETLRAIANIFTHEYGATVQTAVIVLKNTCTFKPDFSAILDDQNEWIVFPWEQHDVQK